MPQPQVIKIESSVQQAKMLKVAAYARVSSNKHDQLNSFATQVKHYSQFIEANKAWKFVGVYADEGITGTSTERRTEFLRMIDDCKKGLIDKIYVKSLSRFSRDNKYCIEIIRELRKINVGIVFEKENIDTLSLTGEIILNMHSSMAQEESLSISRNMQWAIQKRMKTGEYIASVAPYGYRRSGADLIPYEAEAQTVRYIFSLFLSGKSLRRIMRDLESKNIPSPKNAKWHYTTVQSILCNEKYKGDVLCQKEFTPIILPLKKQANKGHKPQYYVENSHEPIISREIFDTAQQILKQKKTLYSANIETKKSALSQMIYCEKCDTIFCHKAPKNQTTWICRNHFENKENCSVMPVLETEIHRAFLIMFNKLLKNKDTILKPMINELEIATKRTIDGQGENANINKQIADLLLQTHKLSQLQTKGFIDNVTFYEKNNKLDREIAELRDKYKIVKNNDELCKLENDINSLYDFLEDETPLVYFDELKFKSLIKKVKIDNDYIFFELNAGLKFKEARLK